MLFYTTILVACLIAAVIFPWLYRVISSVVGVFFKTGRRRSNNLPTSHLSNQTAGVIKKDARDPYAVRQATNSTKAKQETVGDKNHSGQRKVHLKSTDWLNREDCRTENHSSYKIKRRSQGELDKIRKPKNWS